MLLTVLLWVACGAYDPLGESIEGGYCRRGCLAVPEVEVAGHLEELFVNWKKAHGAFVYETLDENSARNAFAENLSFVRSHNSAREAAKAKGSLPRTLAFSVALNRFAGMSNEEFSAVMLQGKAHHMRPFQGVHDTIVFDPGSLPEAWDWRDFGVVSPVQNQGGCNSCWAFVATSAVESLQAIKGLSVVPLAAMGNDTFGETVANKTTFQYGGKLYIAPPITALSQQNLMDCSYREGNVACLGGSVDGALEYILRNHGIDTAESYPYRMLSSTECLYNSTTRGAAITAYANLLAGSEEQLQAAVALHNPVSVCIDGAGSGFQFYEGGIYYNEYCSQWRLDHGLLVVGYGSVAGNSTDEEAQDYWVCKNSYGDGWGADGYILMARNMDNNCGIASHCTYPIM